MKKKIVRVSVIAIIFALFFTGCSSSNNNKVNTSSSTTSNTIVDLAGRKVKLPNKINRILVIHGDPEYIVWRLAPQKLVNKDTYFSDTNDRVFPQKLMRASDIKFFNSLPATGMYSNVSTEQIIALKPQVVFTLNRDPQLNSEEQRFGVPVIAVSKDSLSDFEKSIRLIGQIVGNEKGAEELANYWNNSVSKVTKITSKISKADKLKVYYASSIETNTIGTKTTQASIIRAAGGINFYDENPINKGLEESESVDTSMEQIIEWNPDVIITGSSKLKASILSDSKWKTISAVENKRVYTTLEYACMDHYEALLNLMWTANKLYPSKVKINLYNEAKAFYKEFYYTDKITEKDMSIERN